MDLRSYTDSLPRGGIAALASKLGIERIYLSQLSARQNGREPSPALCVAIERESDQKVRRWDLRPNDWHLIWPELIGARGAPKPKRVAVRARAPEERAESTADAQE